MIYGSLASPQAERARGSAALAARHRRSESLRSGRRASCARHELQISSWIEVNRCLCRAGTGVSGLVNGRTAGEHPGSRVWCRPVSQASRRCRIRHSPDPPRSGVVTRRSNHRKYLGETLRVVQPGRAGTVVRGRRRSPLK